MPPRLWVEVPKSKLPQAFSATNHCFFSFYWLEVPIDWIFIARNLGRFRADSWINHLLLKHANFVRTKTFQLNWRLFGAITDPQLSSSRLAIIHQWALLDTAVSRQAPFSRAFLHAPTVHFVWTAGKFSSQLIWKSLSRLSGTQLTP